MYTVAAHVLAILKREGGGAKSFHSFKEGAQKVLPCLERGGANNFRPTKSSRELAGRKASTTQKTKHTVTFAFLKFDIQHGNPPHLGPLLEGAFWGHLRSRSHSRLGQGHGVCVLCERGRGGESLWGVWFGNLACHGNTTGPIIIYYKSRSRTIRFSLLSHITYVMARIQKS